ncbi:SDR family NAD(P)-dependent oxidoreductase [Geodermatophilus sp. SYSU D01180]
MARMDGKVALVTGAASGIGRATATGLARESAAVVLLVRSAERGERALGDVGAAVPGARLEVLVCDLAVQASIREAARRFRAGHDRLDVLVNAAGVFVKERRLTPDGVELTFATNHLAYFLLTRELLPLLRAGAPARVVNVASRYGRATIDLDDPQRLRGRYSYLRSTPPTMLARVLFTQELARRLAGTGVVANAVHPGLVAGTGLLADVGGPFRWVTDRFGRTPEQGADTVLWLATAPETATVTGKLWAGRRELPTPGQGRDPAAGLRLWEVSERLTTARG